MHLAATPTAVNLRVGVSIVPGDFILMSDLGEQWSLHIWGSSFTSILSLLHLSYGSTIATNRSTNNLANGDIFLAPFLGRFRFVGNFSRLVFPLS